MVVLLTQANKLATVDPSPLQAHYQQIFKLDYKIPAGEFYGVYKSLVLELVTAFGCFTYLPTSMDMNILHPLFKALL